jgi:hypothetical protein
MICPGTCLCAAIVRTSIPAASQQCSGPLPRPYCFPSSIRERPPASLRLPLLQLWRKSANGVMVMGEEAGGGEMGPGRRKTMGGYHGSGKAPPDTGREGRNPLAAPPLVRPRRVRPAGRPRPARTARRRTRARRPATPPPAPASLRAPARRPRPRRLLPCRTPAPAAPPASLHSPPTPRSPPPPMHRRTWSEWSRGGFLLGFHSGLLFVSEMDWLRRASGQVGRWEPAKLDASGREPMRKWEGSPPYDYWVLRACGPPVIDF